ncbi:hypothetical protein IE53DRAFT_181981 [Violaceomyces palustris]|uniref:Uncharacterized protein n=1 Tax=Violaceomyces palustris TaxID=1673888 RepID=A0ACD0NSC7_9BASI|nr:hypothetical protein IE53DRAFT_181981 [Violaceomyces palustris]
MPFLSLYLFSAFEPFPCQRENPFPLWASDPSLPFPWFFFLSSRIRSSLSHLVALFTFSSCHTFPISSHFSTPLLSPFPPRHTHHLLTNLNTPTVVVVPSTPSPSTPRSHTILFSTTSPCRRSPPPSPAGYACPSLGQDASERERQTEGEIERQSDRVTVPPRPHPAHPPLPNHLGHPPSPPANISYPASLYLSPIPRHLVVHRLRPT